MIFPTLIGLLIIIHITRTQKSPADQSNRINKIRLLWFALTREELFIDVFPWLRQDEYDNTSAFSTQQVSTKLVEEKDINIG